jgi:broad specificity phosphatase PhoE
VDEPPTPSVALTGSVDPMRERRVLLVRHGQSTWNAEGRWQGQADVPLSVLGEEQARSAVLAVARLAPAQVVTSDLARAHQTADLVAPPGTQVEIDESWRERDAGEWTGLTRTEIDERFPGWLAERRSPPGFEGDESLLERTLPLLDRLLRGDERGTILVVTHGGVIRTLERHHEAPSVPVPNLGGRWFHAVDGEIVLGDRDLLVDPDAITVPDQI